MPAHRIHELFHRATLDVSAGGYTFMFSERLTPISYSEDVQDIPGAKWWHRGGQYQLTVCPATSKRRYDHGCYTQTARFERRCADGSHGPATTVYEHVASFKGWTADFTREQVDVTAFLDANRAYLQGGR